MKKFNTKTMQTRKKFLRNSSLALASLFIPKIAKSNNSNNFIDDHQILICATNGNPKFSLEKENLNSKLIVSNSQFLLNNLSCVHSGKKQISRGKFPYEIIENNNLRIGVTYLDNQMDLDKVIQISSDLKNKKKCNLVVCVSTIGFKKSGNNLDDVKFANESEYIDVIITQNSNNHCANQFIALNKNNSEVFIINSENKNYYVSNVQFSLDGNGNKFNLNTAS